MVHKNYNFGNEKFKIKGEEMDQKITQEKAITLIALIVTIIVLIILAGVTIAILMDENGMIKRAKIAKEETKKAEYEQELKLIGNGLQPDRVLNQWDNQTYMDKYEKEIEKDDMFKEAQEIKQLPNTSKITIQVIVKEGWIYWVIVDGVEYVGKLGEDIPPDLELEKGNIKFDYDPSDWTNQKVKVSMETNVEGYTLQYSLDAIYWENYTKPVVVENNNQAIHARLINKIGEEGGHETTNITIIDRLSPEKLEPTVTKTENTITLTGNTTDAEATAIDGCSGVEKYYFSKDNGVTWEPAEGQTEESYTFTNLAGGTTYSLKMKAVDKAGNETVSTNELKEKVLGVYVSLKGNTLGFYDNEEQAKEGATKYYGNVVGRVFKRTWSTGPDTPWYGDRGNIQVVNIATKLEPINMACYFSDLTELITIQNIENINTQNVTSMFALFYNCTKLTSIDVSTFSTSNVETMDAMFNNCENLRTLTGLSNFNTSKVTNMNSMFAGCKELTTIDISGFNMGNVTEMGYMFMKCSNLTTIKFPEDIDTSKVTFMREMFELCEKLVDVDVSKFNTQNVENMNTMFSNCKRLKNIDVSHWNTENVTDMTNMFMRCSSLTTLDLSNFNTKKVTNMNNMFYYATNLTKIYIGPDWSVANSSTGQMFVGCEADIIRLEK